METDTNPNPPSQVDTAFIESLKSASDQAVIECLGKLNAEWSKRFELSELDGDTKRSLVDALCVRMENPASSSACKCNCVEIIRIMSRDKSSIDRWIDERLLSNLVNFAGFLKSDLGTGAMDDDTKRLSLEAQKSLCNLMFQSEKARRICIGNGCLDGLCQRLKSDPHQKSQDYDRRFYDLRLLFLMTALCPDVRAKCRDPPMDGLRSLTDIFESLIGSGGHRKSINDQGLNLACETLKVIFNLVLPYKSIQELDEPEMDRLNRLVDISRSALFVQVNDESKKEELHSNVVNLLAAMPSASYVRLTPKIDSATASASPVPIYDGRNMEAIQILLDFLSGRLDKPPREQMEALSPILTLLMDMARKHTYLRKYMRFKVLPPLTDVMTRPEEGTTLRNKLVRLMTSVTTEIKDLAADFLYELCNSNIDRLIKYTGFGNAAGMLSTRGLMGAAVRRDPNTSSADDDENSDTEEYLRVKDQINPIIGCYDPPRPDPMAGMSEEQKEYEAMKLVEQIDKLMKQGVVMPGRLGEDGRVHPVEHVLALAEEAERSGVLRRRRSTSDDEVDD